MQFQGVQGDSRRRSDQSVGPFWQGPRPEPARQAQTRFRRGRPRERGRERATEGPAAGRQADADEVVGERRHRIPGGRREGQHQEERGGREKPDQDRDAPSRAGREGAGRDRGADQRLVTVYLPRFLAGRLGESTRRGGGVPFVPIADVLVLGLGCLLREASRSMYSAHMSGLFRSALPVLSGTEHPPYEMYAAVQVSSFKLQS
ncbi:hypothetical protein OF83DRAFT_436602 [Amylostereum chailletii]|nr:hypothetical protein OF83DRAFT_436602 [Amylostereum chailletii]